MGEDKTNQSNKNYPIKMVALRINWILEDAGKNYLQALLEQESLDLFTSMTNVVIIEFLYKHFKTKILKTKFPFTVL